MPQYPVNYVNDLYMCLSLLKQSTDSDCFKSIINSTFTGIVFRYCIIKCILSFSTVSDTGEDFDGNLAFNGQGIHISNLA